MTSHDEQRLSDALRRQADSADPHLLSLDDVTSRAGSIRRRRVAAGVVAAAAVVAVVVPTAMIATDRATSSTPPPASQNPDPTPDTSQTPSPDPTPDESVDATDKHLDVKVLGDLPTGDGPKILVRVGSEVITPDGARVPVATDSVYSAYVAGSIVTIDRIEGGDQGTFVVRDINGKVTHEAPANIDGALVVTPDRTAAAYVGTDQRIHTWTQSDGDLTFSEPIANIQLNAISGTEPGTCKEQAPEGGGCSVVFSRGEGKAGYATSHGIVDEIPGFLRIWDVSDRDYAGMIESADEGSCSAIQAIETQRRTAKTCNYTFGSFSPDGAYLTGGPAYLDGLCCDRYDVLDPANLESLITIDARGGAMAAYINETGWEDDSHVLATVFDGEAWRLVRIGLDGSAELVDIGEQPQGDTGEIPLRLDVGA